MFEENLFVFKQEFHDSPSRVILETFLELVNQTSYNLFGNKPSCHQGQYFTFCLSNVIVQLYSRIVYLMYLLVQSCCLLFKYSCFNLAIVPSQGYHKSMLLRKCQCVFFFTTKLLFRYKHQIGWQRDDHDCGEESYNQIKTNEILFGCICC